MFSDAGEIVKDQLAVVSHAVALTNLTSIVSGMDVIKQDLAAIQRTTGKLQELASTLGDYLDVTRGELLQELYNCRDIPACRELLNHRHVAELKVVENFNGVSNSVSLNMSFFGPTNVSLRRKSVFSGFVIETRFEFPPPPPM